MACVFRAHCQTCVERGRPVSALLADQRCLVCPLLPAETPHRLSVTKHALERVVERAPRCGTYEAVRHEVWAAITAGRVSEEELPAWVNRPCSPRIRDHAYAWPESKDLVFVLARGYRGELIVKTILALDAEKRAA